MKTEKKSGNGKERGRHEKEKETAVRADYDNYVMGGRERRRVWLEFWGQSCAVISTFTVMRPVL